MTFFLSMFLKPSYHIYFYFSRLLCALPVNKDQHQSECVITHLSDQNSIPSNLFQESLLELIRRVSLPSLAPSACFAITAFSSLLQHNLGNWRKKKRKKKNNFSSRDSSQFKQPPYSLTVFWFVSAGSEEKEKSEGLSRGGGAHEEELSKRYSRVSVKRRRAKARYPSP